MIQKAIFDIFGLDTRITEDLILLFAAAISIFFARFFLLYGGSLLFTILANLFRKPNIPDACRRDWYFYRQKYAGWILMAGLQFLVVHQYFRRMHPTLWVNGYCSSILDNFFNNLLLFPLLWHYYRDETGVFVKITELKFKEKFRRYFVMTILDCMLSFILLAIMYCLYTLKVFHFFWDEFGFYLQLLIVSKTVIFLVLMYRWSLRNSGLATQTMSES